MILSVRRVLLHEYGRYRTHLKALDTESKILRFGAAISNESIDTLCDKIEADKENHVLFCIENDLLEFVAVGHIALQGEMELAFSVWKQHQGQGMGNALMKRCIRYCRTHNVLKGCMICLSHNATIQHLCRKYGIKLQNDHGEILASIELDHPDMLTYVTEQVDSNMAAANYIAKRFSPYRFTSGI